MSTLPTVRVPAIKPATAEPHLPTSAADDPARPETAELILQLKSGDLSGLRTWLARTRVAADWQDRIFQKIRAPSPALVPAWRAMITASSQRWGGSHQQSLELAREAMAAARPGSDMAACLFWAHSLAHSHFHAFDKDPKAAERYANDP